MNSLGSPVDALALDSLSLSFLPVVIHNIWTWVAVMTAAVSFWRMRAVVSPKSDNPDHKSSPPMVSVSARPPHTEEVEAVIEPVVSLTSASLTTTSSLTRGAPPSAADVDTTTEGPTRGKFTAYYDGESEGGGEVAWDGGDQVDEGGVEEVGIGGSGDYWCDNWEKVMRMRSEGDITVWYRYQDLTVLDGNVVRLWNGCL